MYKLILLDSFTRSLSTLTKRDDLLKKKIKKTLKFISIDPSHRSLKTHKVESRNYGVKWSASVDERIRILWDFSGKHQKTIELWDIGTHKLYKGKK